MTIVCGLILGGGLLLTVNQSEAEWQYTDNNGKTRTVTLKSDVPSQYRHTAVPVVNPNTTSSRQNESRHEPVSVPRMEEQQPVVVAPGTKWWTLPAGSPERAAAKQESEQQAAHLRQRATNAGVQDPSTSGSASDPFAATANVCRALVNDTGARGLGVEGAEEFKASVGGGTIHMIGTPEAKFAYAKCMADRGQPITSK